MITYFLLCGYTPFDRDSNLEEMQAILAADYSFTPLEYWKGVSLPARNFIKRCLTIDPTKRMSAHEALSHPWISPSVDNNQSADGSATGGPDLLPVIKKNFNARRTLHAAIDTIRAINKLREGGAAGMMDGALSKDPLRHPGDAYKPKEEEYPPPPGDAMDVDGDGGGSGPDPNAMEIDSRGHARGQTEEQIRLQAKKVQEMTLGLWHERGRTAGRS